MRAIIIAPLYTENTYRSCFYVPSPILVRRLGSRPSVDPVRAIRISPLCMENPYRSRCAPSQPRSRRQASSPWTARSPLKEPAAAKAAEAAAGRVVAERGAVGDIDEGEPVDIAAWLANANVGDGEFRAVQCCLERFRLAEPQSELL